MDSWICFWKYACTIGFSLFFVVVVVVIPLGARDLLRMFKQLESGNPDDDQ